MGNTNTTKKNQNNRIQQPSSATERIVVYKPEVSPKRSSTDKSSTRRILLTLAGPVGSTVLSVLVLWGMLYLKNVPTAIVFVTAILLATRITYDFIRIPYSVLPVKNIRKQWRQVIKDELAISLGLTALVYLAGVEVDRMILAGFLVVNTIIQLIHFHLIRKMLIRYTRSNRIINGCHHIIIAGTGPRARAVADKILDSPEMDTTIEGFLDYRRNGLWRYRDIPLIGHPDQLGEIIADNQVDAVIMACDRRDIPQTMSLFSTAERMGVPVAVLADLYHSSVAHIVNADLGGLPTVTYRAIPESKLGLLVKSIIDRTGALFGLLFLSPLLLITAIIIKLESKGPVFFIQKRSGLNGKLFPLYKFRTMCCDAERLKKKLIKQNEMSGPAFKIRNDPRITKVGRILRKYSIDELPQLFNVLRGEMSLVGPRPPLPSEVSHYKQWQHRKLSVKPGLTCLWQVNGRNNIDFDNWMRLDLEYIDNWTIWLDAKILAKTIPAVMKAEGAS